MMMMKEGAERQIGNLLGKFEELLFHINQVSIQPRCKGSALDLHLSTSCEGERPRTYRSMTWSVAALVD